MGPHALLGIASTTVPFAALLWLSERATASRIALMAYLIPLIGVAGGVLILDDPIGPRLMVGGALILGGWSWPIDRRDGRTLPPPFEREGLSDMKAWLLIVFTGVMFASLGLCTKFLTNRGVDPMICAAVPFGVSAPHCRDFPSRKDPTPWREGLAMGAVNAATPALLFNIGFSRLPASLVTITLALGPVFTALAAHFAFRDDRFSRIKLAGLGLSFGGVALLAGLPTGSGRGSTLAFVATLVGAALSGGTLVWVRRMATRHDPRTVLAPMQAGAAIVAVAAAAFVGHPPWNLGTDTLELGILLAMGIGTVIPYMTSLKASELAPASRVGMMGYIVPLVGVGGGGLLFDEVLTPNLALGGLLILAGVTLVGRSNPHVAPI